MSFTKNIKTGIITGISFFLTVGILGFTYAAITSVSSGDTLTATLWNDMKTTVDANTSSISTNAGNISTNTTNITSNTNKLTNIESSGGNVGIGQTPTGDKLEVDGHVRVNYGVRYNDANGQDGSKWGIYGWDDDLSFALRNNDWTWNSTPMVIQNDGNVGIGTDTPSQKLSVTGLIESTTGGFKFPDGTTQATAYTSGGFSISGSDAYYTAGNVGVGTTTPGSKLDVNGTANVTEITGPWDQSDSGYIRLGDVQIARGQKTGTTRPMAVTFPVAFSEPPTVTGSVPRGSYYVSTGGSNVGPTTTGFNCYITSYSGGATTASSTCHWIAIGKWR